MTAGQPFHVVRYWQRVLWQRKWLIAGFMLAGTLAAGTYLALNPPVYEAQVELVFQADPASTSARGMSEQLLTSEAVLRATWEQLSPVEQQQLEASDVSQAIKQIRSGLSLQSPRRSPQALILAYQSRHPELVVPVLKGLVPSYLDLVTKLHASPLDVVHGVAQSVASSEQTTADLQAIDNITQRIRALESQISEDTQQIVRLLEQADARSRPTNLQDTQSDGSSATPTAANDLALSTEDKTRLEQLQRRVQMRRGLVYDLDWVRASLKNRVAQPLAAAATSLPHVEVTRQPTQATRISTSGQRILATCWLVSLLLAGGAVYLLEQFDRRYRSPLLLEADCQLPVLAVIPTVSSDPVKGLAPLSLSATTLAGCEAVEELRVALDAGKPPRLVTITSPHRGEGASTVARSLAASFARSGQKTLLIETTARYHDQQSHPNDAENWLDLLCATTEQRQLLAGQISEVGEHLHVLLSGNAASPPLELLASDGFAALLNVATGVYDRVILDAAACTTSADASVIGRLSDATVLVVAARRADPAAVLAATERLRSFGVRLAGVVVNRASEEYWWRDAVGYTRGVWGTPRTGWGPAEARQSLSQAAVPTAVDVTVANVNAFVAESVLSNKQSPKSTGYAA